MLIYYMLVFIPIFSLLTGVLVFTSQHKHLLITLLSLEYIMLNILIILIFNMKFDSSLSFLILLFLVFSVSEGSIGLSILVSMVRTHGSDYFKSFNTVW